MSPTLLLLIVIFVIAIWGGGYWYGPAGFKGNNAMHFVLVLLVILLVLHALGIIHLSGLRR